jgi:hypothetical protein
MATHASSLTEAIKTAKPIPGTRYGLGSFLPTVGLTLTTQRTNDGRFVARPRPIYVLTVDGVEVDRGSKADLVGNAKSPVGSPRGACHDRYDRILKAERGQS